MPLELQLISASEFIRLDAAEHLDFKASQEALRALVHGCRKRGLDRAILDLRKVPTPKERQFTTNQLASLVLTFRDAGFARHQRLAVLYRDDLHGGVRDFAFISRMRGFQVQAFTDFEAALQWLSEAKEPHTEGKEIPVRVTKVPTTGKRLPKAR